MNGERQFWMRIAVCLAGLMGAAGMVLAAAAAHAGGAERLGPASTMLLFHACAVLGATALAERNILNRRLGAAAVFAFILGTALFSGDLSMRHYFSRALFAMAAPAGGTLLIVAWLMLALAAIWPARKPS